MHIANNQLFVSGGLAFDCPVSIRRVYGRKAGREIFMVSAMDSQELMEICRMEENISLSK